MSSRDVVRKLETLAELEERGVVVIAKHLRRAVERSSLNEADKRRVAEILDRIAKESEGHQQVLRLLISQLDGCGRVERELGACKTAETA